MDNGDCRGDAGAMIGTMRVVTAADPAVAVAPLSRAAYDQLVELGHFVDRRVELLEGVLVEMPPMSDRHAMAIVLLTRWFARGLDDALALRPQVPLAASDYSEPEPDIAVVRMSTDPGHPTTALLAVEVTLSTHHTDLVVKPAVYAAAGIPRYWVVDLAAGRLVEHTSPGPDGYADVVVHHPPTVLTAEGVEVDLAQLLA